MCSPGRCARLPPGGSGQADRWLRRFGSCRLSTSTSTSSPAPCAPKHAGWKLTADGLERLERQRRAIRLNSWIDRDTGMGRWAVDLGPGDRWSGLRTGSRPKSKRCSTTRQPDGCPTDLLEKQSYLRALALLALLDGKGVRLGRPEIVVVDRPHRPGPGWASRSSIGDCRRRPARTGPSTTCADGQGLSRSWSATVSSSTPPAS